jgi:hypothetical protein
MSSSSVPRTPPQVSREAAPASDYYEDDERGYGWVVFAGTLLLLVGSINVIQGIAAIGNANSNQIAERHSEQWDAWRFAAQRAARAWNEWLAAGGRERPELYRCYVCALAEEEQAAVAIERTVSREATAQHARDTASESEQELAG